MLRLVLAPEAPAEIALAAAAVGMSALWAGVAPVDAFGDFACPDDGPHPAAATPSATTTATGTRGCRRARPRRTSGDELLRTAKTPVVVFVRQKDAQRGFLVDLRPEYPGCPAVRNQPSAGRAFGRRRCLATATHDSAAVTRASSSLRPESVRSRAAPSVTTTCLG